MTALWIDDWLTIDDLRALCEALSSEKRILGSVDQLSIEYFDYGSILDIWMENIYNMQNWILEILWLRDYDASTMQ